MTPEMIDFELYELPGCNSQEEICGNGPEIFK